MNTPLLHARQTKYIFYAVSYLLIVVTILVVGNVLADRYNKSYDSTANKRYSLSPQTAKIVKGLKQPAAITYYNRSTHFEDGKDLLTQYSDLSPKVTVKYVDPDKNPEQAVGVDLRGKYDGTAVVQVGARKEQVKDLTEEGITGAFIRDLKSNTRTVCFVEGSGEHSIEDSDKSGFSNFKDLLGKDEYESKSINLITKAEVPSECTVLVVGGPESDYLQPEVDAIKKYVEDGGRAFFMLDPPLKMGRAEIADNDALNKVLEGWGVTPEKNLILDLNPIGQIAGLGPQVALVTSYDSHAIVNDMSRRATGFPLARSIQTKNGDKTTVTQLFSTSDTSLATTKLNSPSIDPSDPKNTKGPLLLAAAGTYSTGKENSQGRFVVIGCSNWAANSFIRFNGNRDLALNAVNWLASDEDLISIRPKERDDRRITITTAQLRWIKITSQFLLPLLVIFGGVSVWWRRR
jgi:gliding motility-associatede transport system auxiliary component